MKIRNAVAMAFVVGVLGGACPAQNLDSVSSLWKKTVSAVRQNDDAAAHAALAEFTASALSYVNAHGRNWQIEYLIGSVDCMFADRRQTGAEFLQDILANNRTLNQAGQAELKRQLAACTGHANNAPTTIDTATPPDVSEVSTHYQAVGVVASMKGGGGNIRPDQESAGVASPLPAAELAARLVPIDQPQKALHNALARLSPGARGATDEGFAVVSVNGSSEEAGLTGDCLKRYAQPLRSEFEIGSSQYMITAYSVSNGEAVYDYALKLHGLKLPYGVLAYSVPDDMSLVAADAGAHCGSMAHELVHLLIRHNFPGAPAWLEEGLASEVAIATPTPQRLRFGWSWRDDTLQRDQNLSLSLQNLLDMPWSALNSYQRSDARQAEANQALAAVFIRYLDAKGKLADVYFNVRDQHFNPDLSGFKSYREILEEKMGKAIDAIDADFKRWFSGEALEHTHSAPGIMPQRGTLRKASNAAAQSDCAQADAQNPAQTAVTHCTPTMNASPNAPAEPSPNAAAKPN